MTEDPLSTPVQFVRGVGPERAVLLERLGLQTVEDMLLCMPRGVLDLSAVRSIWKLEADTLQTVRGIVVDRDAREISGRRSMQAVLIESDGNHLRGVWFNQDWVLRRLQLGDRVLFSGKPKRRGGRWEMHHPRIQWLAEDDPEGIGEVLPKYRLTEGLKLHTLRRMMRNAVADYSHYLVDHLPAEYARSLSLIPRQQAVRQLHQPASREEYEQSRRRLVFDDLLEFQVGLALRRRVWHREHAAERIAVTARIDARIRRLFPFEFTEGQNAAVRDIVADLSSGRAMHRLLQADVGAGKTAVAVYAMLAVIAAGHQTVLMAPTEVLANQHWETLDELLRHSRVQRLLLTGNLTAAQRRDALQAIAAGEIQLIVGTQAVIQQDVTFARLGLAVIDEQHKFGVMQRARFSQGDARPHVLVMTATPIPRSLCLTQFGDLDVTAVMDQPPGRQKIVTSSVGNATLRTRAWDFVRKQLDAGRQAYVVCPRVETNEDDLQTAVPGSAECLFERLAEDVLCGYRVGLVHGQMDRRQRAETMEAFRAGDVQVLVSTTVIEVGVDVPNATVMVVYQADRFGLSQLHQLRGRIGRGRFQGYCLLVIDGATPDAERRLSAMESTSDGFAIAEVDFELRGPGDVLGTRQHGQLPLRVADLIRDQEELRDARTAAFELVQSGQIDQPAFAPLKIRVLERFGQLMELPQSG